MLFGFFINNKLEKTICKILPDLCVNKNAIYEDKNKVKLASKICASRSLFLSGVGRCSRD